MLLVVGTATVDLVLTGVDRLPAAGADEFTPDTIAFLDDPVRLVVGGNGGNAALAHARLGGATELCAAIGEDELGTLLAGRLAAGGVGLEGLVRLPGLATSCTAVATNRALRRVAFHHAGSARVHAPADVPASLVSAASAMLLASYHLLPRWRDGAAVATLRRARDAGAVTADDIGPCIDPLAGIDELVRLGPEVDYLLANAHELSVVTGLESIPEASRLLLDVGIGAVVVKLGAAGAQLLAEGIEVRAPASEVEVRETIGAGDTFDAGFLFAVARGDAPHDALRFANATAALMLAHGEGTAGVPGGEEVDAELR